MASTSSSSSVSVKKYDVFISFRGEDTRGDFTSHLHAALCRNSIETYIDYRIQKGDEVWVELVKAIKESNLFLVIFSENYASSSWCLNELVELMECRKQGEDVDVIPVFYRIEPSQVRKQSGSYETALAKHKKDGKVSRENMQKWKNALFHAANLSGFDSHAYRTESDLIEDIVKVILKKLNYKSTCDFRSFIIYDENYENIESSLKIDSKEVRVIGIWGMGGIGKTTLAAAIFNKVSSQYEATCFLENVAEESKRHGLNYVCNKLLSKLLREDLHIDTAKVIPSIVTRRLRRKKVLIVLDDVNTSQLLENLVGVGRDWLGAGSRVIVTTRDKHVLISGDVDKIHQVKEMNFQNSLKLFGFNAFGKTYPKKEYVELSNEVMVYAKGVPLALKVLGSFLRSKSELEWVSTLRKLEKIPNGEIQAVLRLSYDGLDDDDEKNIFLDIACYYKGQKRDYITNLLNAFGFSADIGISRLLDKALLTTTCNNCIDMHHLIQEMGWAIVREENIQNPGQRSRLWDPEEVYDVLKNKRGTGAVEGIWLDMSQIKNINLSSKAFRKMPNLRLLAFLSFNGDSQRTNSVYLPKGLEFLPKQLRYFGWNGYPLESLPSTFCPQKLVELSMHNSKVKKLWHGEPNLANLESIDLSGSKHLMECPNLSHAPKVKKVFMDGCESLTYLDPSIWSLPKLEILNVCRCTSLNCLNNNPWSSQSLRQLHLRGSGLNELPPSILLIRNLRSFSFTIHSVLLDLPENFVRQIVLSESKKHERDTFFTLQKLLPSSGFRSLICLIFFKCESLCEIPNNISLISSLKYLLLHVCDSIIGFPESIKYLSRLQLLEVSECKMLQSIPALPQSIQRLHVWKCQSLQTVSCSTIEPSKTPERIFLLPNCITLDEHSYDAILRDAIVRIELGAKPPAATVLENKEDATTDNYLHESSKIGYSLPARSGKVRDWFHCHFTQALVTIEFPPNLSGFIFYLVVPQVQSCHIGCCGSIGCECYLENGRDERINITSFFSNETAMLSHLPPFQYITDHVFLWYDAKCCKQIMEVIKERKTINDKSTTHDPKLKFKFFAKINDNNQEVIVKECGFRWMYSLEKGGSMSKRKREVHESNEQEEAFPPTKKLKQWVFGTSNLEVEGIEELSHMFDDMLKVDIEKVLQPKAQVPQSTNEVRLVKQAANTFILWPSHLIRQVSQQQALKPTSTPRQSEPTMSGLDQLLGLTNSMNDRTIQVQWDRSVCGIDTSVPLHITRQDLSDVLQENEMLSITILQLWNMYLHRMTISLENEGVYGFLDPLFILQTGNRQEEVQSYIANWLHQSRKRCYLAPYLNGGHWQLLVICPQEHIVVLLCSINKAMEPNFKKLINQALATYIALSGCPGSSTMNVEWIVPHSAQQRGSTECGYYVMKHMLTIVSENIIGSWKKIFTYAASFPQSALDEIRKMVATYMVELSVGQIS